VLSEGNYHTASNYVSVFPHLNHCYKLLSGSSAAVEELPGSTKGGVTEGSDLRLIS
jgi:hypothetical protein